MQRVALGGTVYQLATVTMCPILPTHLGVLWQAPLGAARRFRSAVCIAL